MPERQSASAPSNPRPAAFVSDQSGATAIEYGLIAALIGVAIIVSVIATGTGTADLYEANFTILVEGIAAALERGRSAIGV